MASINQLEKWLASAEAKIEKKKSILIKHENNYTKAEAKLKGTPDEWQLNYNLSMVEDCKAAIRDIEQDIERYRKELEEKKVAAAQEEAAYDFELERVLSSKLEDDKKRYIEYIRERAEKYHDEANDNKRILDAEIASIYQCKAYTRNTRDTYIRQLRNELTKVITALRFSREAYADKEESDARDYYDSSIKNMVCKLRDMGIDKENMTISYPKALGLGMEMLITDGTNREIHARLIWAAEESSCVTAHLRFIVTERKIK